jgi:hypothetical protein
MVHNERSATPTRKWIATQITALAALMTAWISIGEWDKTLTISAVGLLTQAVVGYILPNANTPGGVPLKRVDQKTTPAALSRQG